MTAARISVPSRAPAPVLGPVLALLALLGLAPAAYAQDSGRAEPYHLIIGIDISEGSPFTSDRGFAAKTAKRIGARVGKMPMRSQVTFRTFGAHSTTDANLDIDRELSRNQTPEATQVFLEAIISGIPELVAQNRLQAQQGSNIIGFLTSMSRMAQCDDRRTVFVIATDGLEDSEYADMAEGASLPAPSPPRFQNCARLELLGLGRGGGSPELTNRVIEEWRSWGDQAGFALTVGLDTW